MILQFVISLSSVVFLYFKEVAYGLTWIKFDKSQKTLIPTNEYNHAANVRNDDRLCLLGNWTSGLLYLLKNKTLNELYIYL